MRSLSEVESNGGFVGSFDLVIPFTLAFIGRRQKILTLFSVEIESWTVEEPLKDEFNIDRTLGSYRKTRDIILEKIKERFKKFFL